MAAAMVADPTPTTAATRTPPAIDGMASGSSTYRSSSRRRHPHRDAGFANRRVDPGQARDRRPHDRQQPVQNQHDDGGTRADAADERHGQQEAEHRQARNRLHDVREADDRRAHPRPARGKHTERNADGDRRQRGHGHERHMLRQQRRQLGAMRRPEKKKPGHGAARRARCAGGNAPRRQEARGRADRSSLTAPAGCRTR